MPTFELTAAGLSSPRYAEARALVVQRWRARFGANAQTAEDSTDGLMITIIALMLTLAWEGIAATHAASYFRTAEGVYLDFVLDLFGRRRLPAAASTLSAVFYGDNATAVPALGVASVADTEERFTIDSGQEGDTVEDGDGGPIVVRILTAVEGNVYAIDVDTTTESTYEAQPGDDNALIADGLAAQLVTDNPDASVLRAGLDPDGAALIVLEDLGAGVVTVGPSADEAADQDVRYGRRVTMTANNAGPVAALAGTLNVVVSVMPDIDGVCTTADADLGRLVETDPAFRARHLDQLNSGGAGSPEAIRARVLALNDAAEPTEIDYVRVFENESDTTDADGRPPHSFEVVWVGEEGTAAEEAVALAIWQAKPAGIQAYGSIDTEIEDSAGDPQTVGHSRGTERYLHLDVTITPGEGYPTTGDPLTAIRDAIAAYFQEGGARPLGLGDDFYRVQAIAPAIAAVAGIAAVVIETDDTAAPGDPPTFTAADITVAADTILIVDSSRIDVHE